MLPRLLDYLEPRRQQRGLVWRSPSVEPARNLLVRHDAPRLDVGQALRSEFRRHDNDNPMIVTSEWQRQTALCAPAVRAASDTMSNPGTTGRPG